MVDAWIKLATGDPALLSDDHPENVGLAAAKSAGNDPNASRDDHVHILGSDVVLAANIANDAVGSEHIEALSAPLDCGQQELQNAVLHQAASDPADPVVGQVYMSTADGEIYLRVAVP